MGKKRIHELAKELSLTSAELIQKILEWKLLPGVKLVASSGLEDYLIEDIARRLGSYKEATEPTIPQVIRRRKKSQSDLLKPASFEPATGAPIEEDVVSAVAAKLVEKTAIPLNSAILNVQVKKNVSATVIFKPALVPDFKQLQPNPSSPSKDIQSETPPSDLAVGLIEGVLPLAKAKVATEPGKTAQLMLRKVTRELSDPPARIIPPPKGNFDAARVVGSKPNWKETPVVPKPAFNSSVCRPTGGGGEGNHPRTGDFRRSDSVPVVTVSLLEAEVTRRRDKRKKSQTAGRFEADDNAGAKLSRRRNVVERTDLYSEGDWERVRRRGKNVKKAKAKTEITTPKAIKRRIKVDEVITVFELAHRLSIKAGDIIKKLMSMGVMAGLNQALDFDTATLVAAEFGYEVDKSAFDEENILNLECQTTLPETDRPPVVTIMGHVDHGKTSLLDYIRKTNIQIGEAGGITQHIGAYHVQAGGRNITFLDTPGHEAFTSMRSRGAQVTDLVVLIVAADDGLMPQTREAADHAKAAGVPILVAVNKIDKPGADAEKVRREMMEIGLVPEAWGGDTVFVEISAKTGKGVAELLDMILLQADVLELKARPDGPARGRIIEARLDKGRGPVATVLVQEGLLRQGDAYVCGVFHGRIRAMLDDQGDRVSEVGPAIPVEVQGISGVPQAGDEFIVLEDEKQARQISQHRLLRQRESELIQTSKLTLENLFDNIRAGAIKGLNLIIKTDVQGSLEAIVDAVMKLSTLEMKINIIHQGASAVSETDIVLASASNALIICFAVRPSVKVQELADAEHIQIRYYNVIYKLIDDIKEAMAGLLDPVRSEKILGRAEVRAIFVVSRVGTIAGSYVLDGKIVRGAKARLLRDSVVIHDGRLSSLKRVKEDVREVAAGYECGIGFENYNDVKVGDLVEVFHVEETAATVELIDEAVARATKEKERTVRAEEIQDEGAVR
ncbi:MAG: hypothetical protein AMR96_04650 [Candidatus Adiutrix intracellularis]|jgi:translation initiation factor IF-2|nr:MAG: hypothetical protein AMR96_04650 [Candidatus Adiutrix intracellularis]